MSDYAEHLVRAKQELAKAEQFSAERKLSTVSVYLLRCIKELERARKAIDALRS